MGHKGDYPLGKTFVKEWEDARRTADALEGSIIDRIDYVLKVWFKAFDCELKNWYFEGAEESSMGDLHCNDDSIYSIHIDNFKGDKVPHNDMIIIDKDGGEYGWESEIPLRWLFEDCEQEIVEGRKKYEKREAFRKESLKTKRAKQKAEDLALADGAMAKLSKKELAALKKVL